MGRAASSTSSPSGRRLPGGEARPRRLRGARGSVWCGGMLETGIGRPPTWPWRRCPTSSSPATPPRPTATSTRTSRRLRPPRRPAAGARGPGWCRGAPGRRRPPDHPALGGATGVTGRIPGRQPGAVGGDACRRDGHRGSRDRRARRAQPGHRRRLAPGGRRRRHGDAPGAGPQRQLHSCRPSGTEMVGATVSFRGVHEAATLHSHITSGIVPGPSCAGRLPSSSGSAPGLANGSDR